MKYEYKVVHVTSYRSGSEARPADNAFENELNRLGKEGYRVVPGLSNPVIMERIISDDVIRAVESDVFILENPSLKE
jgi:Domain of unknown function (DUF4177)